MKKALTTLLIVLLSLTACVKPTTEPTGTEEASPASPPVAQTNCTNSAAFVADVSIPDGTSIPAGEAFTKTWQIKNTGSCTWTIKYSLVFALGAQMSAPESTVILPPTAPGNTLEISVDMLAPETNGEYRADFQLLDPNGNAIPIDDGWYMWVSIVVEDSTIAPEPTETEETQLPGFAEVNCSFTTEPARAADLVNAINAYRAQNGLPPLMVDAQLTQAAQAHSQDMACNNLFVHVGSNGSTPESRANAAGYQASALSENVYGHYPAPSSQEAVTWWATDTTDPMHNTNLLSSQFTVIGAGYAFFDNFGYFAVVFAAP